MDFFSVTDTSFLPDIRSAFEPKDVDIKIEFYSLVCPYNYKFVKSIHVSIICKNYSSSDVVQFCEWYENKNTIIAFSFKFIALAAVFLLTMFRDFIKLSV